MTASEVQYRDGHSRGSLSDFADLSGIDPDAPFNPYELEGILSDYSDTQSSAEWVRSVRDGP
ncbi:MAG: hypothetical protein OXI27_07475 [Thaumarchaeota archaeon]|nr:hypothetical protein [Nitrososphaerota archaeon]MDE0526414.1 hypothetical protein [Nitrososphaerota archaeon]